MPLALRISPLVIGPVNDIACRGCIRIGDEHACAFRTKKRTYSAGKQGIQ